MALNKAAIHDAAARLFWSLASEIGVRQANDLVISSNGLCLLDGSTLIKIPGFEEFDRYPPQTQLAIFNAITGEAVTHATRGENMVGILYAEDSQSGRSPDAKDIDTRNLFERKRPTKGLSINQRHDTLGRLCIRHPLPAVVYTIRAPRSTIFEVSDTFCALGFQNRMYMHQYTVLQVDANLYACIGLFLIPITSQDDGKLWGQVIQNSTFVPDGTEVAIVGQS